MVQEDAKDLSLHDDNGVEQIHAAKILRNFAASLALFEVTHRH